MAEGNETIHGLDSWWYCEIMFHQLYCKLLQSQVNHPERALRRITAFILCLLTTVENPHHAHEAYSSFDTTTARSTVCRAASSMPRPRSTCAHEESGLRSWWLHARDIRLRDHRRVWRQVFWQYIHRSMGSMPVDVDHASHELSPFDSWLCQDACRVYVHLAPSVGLNVTLF